MTYAVLIKPSARRELEALPDQLLRRTDRVIASLGAASPPRGSITLRGMADLFRVRIADYRVVYRVDDVARVGDMLGCDPNRAMFWRKSRFGREG